MLLKIMLILFFKADVSQYPAEWTAVVPYSSRSNQLREDRERMTLLQHRDLSPADYNELLALDGPAFSAPSLHEHLVNALPDIATSDYSGQKCKYCSISLSVDRTAKQFPCPSQHIVHRTCAMSILLSALSASEYGLCLREIESLRLASACITLL